MKRCFRIDSIQSESEVLEVLSDYIDSQYIKTDARKRKVIAQAKAIKHANALSNNNYQKEVKHD